MLGYENDNKSYCVLRLSDSKVVISWHMIFDKTTFPTLNSARSNSALIIPEDSSVSAAVVDESHPADMESVDEVRPMDPELDDTSRMVDEVHVAPELDSADSAPPCKKSRIKVIGPWHPTIISSAVDSHHILPYSRRLKVFLSTHDESPRTFKKPLSLSKKEVWSSTIQKELSSMNCLQVWDVFDLKPNYKLVGTTCFFRTKCNHLNEVIEHKARLCAQGFTQTPGVDFEKTNAPTGRMHSLQTLISYSASKNLLFHQVDIKSAFLNAPLAKTVYLSLPQGLELHKNKTCLRLNKAIYGLKQALLAWYKRLKNWLTEVGLTACLLDPCVFYRNKPTPIWLYVHIDDISIFGSDVKWFKD
ncbi:hypothetical protein O181_031546 [Austropuccinia psidii MF-1]|uniref:Reverse transcriptase Ty1/copia-type domain-containing protein n=1 Tax=Austropuccinia psidii MF-1 TaxID=1389203 RepID=A0A9Q3H5A7_9BASI|nr:hypothetical protein [Austropuccinia psidii MF-1]